MTAATTKKKETPHHINDQIEKIEDPSQNFEKMTGLTLEYLPELGMSVGRPKSQ